MKILAYPRLETADLKVLSKTFAESFKRKEAKFA